ncbi:hypothetical protein ACVILK_000725 [Bradyrhizobium embrapense]
MDYDVVKPFNTVNRRFKPDDDRSNVVRSDDHIEPHTIETLKSRGFIKEQGDKPAPLLGPLSAPVFVAPDKPEPLPKAAPPTSEK